MTDAPQPQAQEPAAAAAPANAAATTDGKPIEPLMPAEELKKFADKAPIPSSEDAAKLTPPPTKEEAHGFAREFLLGELIKSVKTDFLLLDKPFSKLSEHQQESLLRRVQQRMEAAVKQAVETIASSARLTFRADVDSVTFKDGVKVALKLGKSEHAHTLADKSGSSVLIVVEDFAHYLNPGDATRGEPDQPTLFDKSVAGKDDRNERTAADKPKAPPRKKKAPGRTASKKGRGK